MVKRKVLSAYSESNRTEGSSVVNAQLSEPSTGRSRHSPGSKPWGVSASMRTSRVASVSSAAARATNSSERSVQVGVSAARCSTMNSGSGPNAGP
jgi:hypothetical protein